MRSLKILGAIVLLTGGLIGTAGASTIAYDNAAGPLSLQNWGGSLGLDFQVNETIRVTALGAFYNGTLANLNGKDGTSGVTVLIYDLSNNQQVGTAVNFTISNFGSLINGDAFLPVDFLLPVGQYSV